MKLGYSIYEKIFHWAFIVNKCLEIKKQTTANIMTQDLLRFEKWYAPSMKELSISSSKTPKQKPSATVTWRNFKGELSPVDAYKYLKARFGAPNGITMIGKQQSLDNLIHWHYTIFCEGYRMDYFGHSNGMEIIFSHPDKDIMDIKREIFILAMKGEFRNHSKAIADVQRGFETWTLFVNPFVRLSQTIDALIADLKKLTLDEPVTPHVPSPRSAYEEYSMQLEVWSKNITKSAAIGTTIRMLLPVRAESFINLILYICRKREFIEDERLYEGLIRNPIDIRVKSLHMNCDGFSKAVNGKDSRFLVFHTMMNKRNDFLHGNINPSNQKIETVYIDGAFTPLFHDDESIFKKMISKYAIGVSEKEVQQDVQVVADLIELVLECLDPPTRIKIESLMNERFPGIRENTKEICSLIPNKYAESLVVIEPKPTENPDYQVYVGEEGLFILYIPADWKCEVDENRYRFRPIKENSQQLLLTTMDLEQSKINISETWQKKTSGHNEFYLISQMEANNAVHKSYCLIQHDKIALFTYTKDDHDENERWNKNIAVESIIGSFGFVSEESRVDVVHQYRYNNFIKGVAASQKLIHQGINNGCFFESVVLLLAQIDAMIRIAIVFDRRLKGLDEQFETSLLYSDKTAPQKSFEEIVNEATTRGIIETTLRDEIETALRKKSILDRFIITSTSLFDVQKYAYSLFGISGKVNEVVKMLEQQLSDAGLSAFIHPDTEEFYKYYIKSKLGDAERK